MADLVFVLIAVGFFALMVLLVRACDHIIGPDGPDLVDGDRPEAEAAGSIVEKEMSA